MRAALRTLTVRTPAGRAGIVAVALAVALAVTALGLSQSAAAQVTSLFDARRAAQVTAGLTRDDPYAPWDLRLDTLAAFPGVTGVELWRHHSQLPLSIGTLTTTTADLVVTDTTPGAASGSTITWASADDGVLDPGEALLGESLAARIGLGPLDSVPEIIVGGQRLRIVGLLVSDRSGTAAGAAFTTTSTPLTHALSPTAELYLTTAAGAARQVAERLPLLADPYASTRFEIDPVLGPEAFTGTLTGSVSASLHVLAGVAGVAGLGTVVFVNLLGITSRTAEIGVRRAFGARRAEIVVMIATECCTRALMGAIVGLTAGMVAIVTVTITARWEPVLDLRLLAVPLVGALVFGLVGGAAPALHASRIEPADAVRS